MSEIADIVSGLRNLLILENLPPIDVADRNYWFLRTQGGEFFDEFYCNDYIAIGWDDVPLKNYDEYTDDLKRALKEKGYGQPTRVLNQVHRFCCEMRKGDIVIIPSSGSAILAFGKVMEDIYFEKELSEEELEDGKCPYRRRRNISWIKVNKRNLIDPKLFAFFRNQQALASANEYDEFIERAINPFYVKNNIAHLNLSVNITHSPKATEIPKYILGVTDCVFKMAEELNIDIGEPEVRINVQSAGIIEFFGNPNTIYLIGIIFIGLCGGKFECNTLGLKLKTDGLVKILVDAYSKVKNIDNKFISGKQLEELHKSLNVEDPRDEK